MGSETAGQKRAPQLCFQEGKSQCPTTCPRSRSGFAILLSACSLLASSLPSLACCSLLGLFRPNVGERKESKPTMPPSTMRNFSPHRAIKSDEACSFWVLVRALLFWRLSSLFLSRSVSPGPRSRPLRPLVLTASSAINCDLGRQVWGSIVEHPLTLTSNTHSQYWL